MSFANIFEIAKKEYRTYFSSPIAYVVAGLFFVASSFMFVQIFFYFVAASMGGGRPGVSVAEQIFGVLFGNINFILLVLVPVLTMRLFAEEKKNRTIDLLMTSPISAVDIVVGKFAAGLFIVWTVLATMAVYPLLMRAFGHFDMGPVFTSFLGLALLSAIYVAVGVFASSLTESVIIAGFVAFIIILFLLVIGWASATLEGSTGQNVFNYLSIMTHLMEFTKGVIDTSGVIYFLSLSFFFCFLTHQVVESARWR